MSGTPAARHTRASKPLAAAPITSIPPWASSMLFRPTRIATWSSTISTRIGPSGATFIAGSRGALYCSREQAMQTFTRDPELTASVLLLGAHPKSRAFGQNHTSVLQDKCRLPRTKTFVLLKNKKHDRLWVLVFGRRLSSTNHLRTV